MRVTVEKTVNIALSVVTILKACIFIKSMQVSWRGYLMNKV